jgi:amino acid adenylation domain-containing protein
MLLYGNQHAELFEQPSSPKVLHLGDESLFTADPSDLIKTCTPEDVAYVIYTSGSTGRPKGVMVPHRGLVNLTWWLKNLQEITTFDRCSKYAGPAFDASIMEIFPCLIAGATLHLIPTELRLDFPALNEYFEANGITLCFLPTQACEQFMQSINNRSLRVMLTGGDRLRQTSLHNDSLKNCYGPSEYSVVTTSYEVKPGDVHGNIPIGKPIANTCVYLVDEDHHPVPIGEIGELCISGAGLSTGYLNDPELTAKRFVPNPFYEEGADTPCTPIMYRTGDLARWLPDGNLEFAGRMDDQVKIRGFRIELGDIESHLLSHPDIQDAVVLARETSSSNEQHLCAYYTGTASLVPNIKAYLAERLPAYMVPSFFVHLEAMPITPNGKVDKKALPELARDWDADAEHVAPRDETEQELATIWSGLLGVKQAGVKDRFFDLGGNSLAAVRLLSAVQKNFEVRVPISAFLNQPTIEDLALEIKKARSNDRAASYVPIQPIPRQERYPMSSAQKRMYVLHQAGDSSTLYNEPMFFAVEGDFDPEKWKQAFRQVVSRHESLRSAFLVDEGEFVRIVRDDIDDQIPVVRVTASDIDSHLEPFVQPFNLSAAPLFRVKLLHVEEKKFVLMLDFHHIIIDGLSMEVIWHDLQRFYEGLEVEELRIQYKEYVAWNERDLERVVREQEAYWLDQFAQEIPVLDLPTDFHRPVEPVYDGSAEKIIVRKERKEKFVEIASKQQTTLFVTLFSAFNVWLSRISGQQDLVVGIPVANRPHPDLQSLVGMFVNTLAIRSRIDSSQTFDELVEQIRSQVLQAFDHQDYPLDLLVEKLNIKRDANRNPLFDVMFVYQNQEAMTPRLNGTTIVPYEHETKIAKFDITFIVTECPEHLQVELVYNTRLFKRDFIRSILNSFGTLLEQLGRHPDKELKRLDMLTADEKRRLVADFNHTRAEYPSDHSFVELFEEQVEQTPDNIALVFQDESLTYRDLNRKANQLARQLRRSGVSREDIVPIVAEPSSELIVGILGVLKAGGTYLPISPDNPADRINYIIQDSGARTLLVYGAANVDAFERNVLDLKEEDLFTGETDNLGHSPAPTDAAYVIYTSGSTGNPKGVVVSHRSLLNISWWFIRQNQMTAADRCSKYIGIGFDPSVLEIYPTFLAGASLHVIPSDMRLDLSKLNQYFEHNRITVCVFPTAVCEQFMKYDNRSLRVLNVGGDRFLQYQQRRYVTQNLYGPTETTVLSTNFVMNNLHDHKQAPIGKPVANTSVYILDPNDLLVPVGVFGELCISGAGVAKGYLNKPELTAQKFVPNPFHDEQEGYSSTPTMYRTGDLARWLPDGNLEFAGRVDDLVKIRGYRIELGEIESKLLAYEEIEGVVVLAKDRQHRNEKYLCAYYQAPQLIPLPQLRAFLLKQLPDYMVPTYFVHLEVMPLTPNGKVDKKSLPQPMEDLLSDVEHVVPRNERENVLGELWKSILGVERVGVLDNFFDLGGNSLSATLLSAQIQETFGVRVPLSTLFAKSTVEGLALEIEQGDKQPLLAMKPSVKKEFYPLSPQQKRLYVQQMLDESITNYNTMLSVRLDDDLHGERLSSAFQQLIQRHESLRTSFVHVEGEARQRIWDDAQPQIERISLGKGEAYPMSKPFDLSKAPLFRVYVIEGEDGSCELCIDSHHIVMDGISAKIFVEELISLDQGIELPPVTAQYREYSELVNSEESERLTRQQEAYWLELFKDGLPQLDLPTDHKRASLMEYKGKNREFTIPRQQTGVLRDIARRNQTTLFNVLLAVYNVFLYSITGQEDLVVGTPVGGRNIPGLERTIGMFVNTVCLRNQPIGSRTFQEFLQDVTANSLAAFEHQDYPFDDLVRHVAAQRDYSRNPIFDTMFAMQSADLIQTELSQKEIIPIINGLAHVMFDMNIQVFETGDLLSGIWEYRSQLFEEESIDLFINRFLVILNQIVQNPTVNLSECFQTPLNSKREDQHGLSLDFTF